MPRSPTTTRAGRASSSPRTRAAWRTPGSASASATPAREKFTDAIPAYRTAIRMFEAEKARRELRHAPGSVCRSPSRARSISPPRSKAPRRYGRWPRWSRAKTCRGAPRSASARSCASCRAATRPFAHSRTRLRGLIALPREAPTNPEARHALDDSASAWSGLALARATAGDASGALSALEARHAHIRRVQLSAFQRDITRGATPEELADEQAIVRELISTRVQLKAERERPSPTRPGSTACSSNSQRS